MRRRLAYCAIAAIALASGCTGIIEPVPGSEGPGGETPLGPSDPAADPSLDPAGDPPVTPGEEVAWNPGDPLTEPGEPPPPEQRLAQPADPGGVRLRRLNRVEYNNTVHDLLGTTLTPADDFPDDDVSYGFDTIAATLSTSPLHLEMYERSAEVLIDDLISAPLDAPRRQAILFCDAFSDPGCARDVLASFASRAWRRPASTAEVDRLFGLVEFATGQGGSLEDGVRVALQAVIMSPHFVYRVEVDPAPTSEAPHRLSSYELASRLSYFLWSTMPDAELTRAADEQTLQNDAELQLQVARMLASDRASALVDHFAGQWLFTRSIGNYQPDYNVFPDFDEELRQAMREETERFVESFFTGSRLITEMLSADFTFANARLGEHYGLDGLSGDFREVNLAGTDRVGLLTQGSVLLVTSTPTRTSPVKRGKWVLDQLLCSPPSPPPPGVEGLQEGEEVTGTLRERLELHRTDPVCASCHSQMDPIGLGLENFDGIGAYRQLEQGVPIDASGELPDGQTFEGAAELAEILAQDTRFDACVTQQMLTYAIGKPFGNKQGRPWVSYITQDARSRGGTLKALVESIVSSEVFRSRRAVPEEVAP